MFLQLCASNKLKDGVDLGVFDSKVEALETYHTAEVRQHSLAAGIAL